MEKKRRKKGHDLCSWEAGECEQCFADQTTETVSHQHHAAEKKICHLEFFPFGKLIHLVGVFCFPLYMESIFDMASDTNSTCEQQAWNNKTLNHIKKLFFRRRQCKRSNFALEPGRWVLHHKMHCVPHQSRRRSNQSGPGIQGGYNGIRSRHCYLVLRLFDCHPQCDTCKGSNLDHESAIRKSNMK